MDTPQLTMKFCGGSCFELSFYWCTTQTLYGLSVFNKGGLLHPCENLFVEYDLKCFSAISALTFKGHVLSKYTGVDHLLL